jgi:hypothetical protein
MTSDELQTTPEEQRKKTMAEIQALARRRGGVGFEDFEEDDINDLIDGQETTQGC